MRFPNYIRPLIRNKRQFLILIVFLSSAGFFQNPTFAQEIDTTKQSIFEKIIEDPYTRRYSSPASQGWIPVVESNTEVKFSGFIQMNYIYDAQNAGFPYGSFFPIMFPVPTDKTSKTTFDPRTSRFTFETRTKTEKVGAIRTVFDMDLYNDFDSPFLGFRVRQAYVTWVGPLSRISFTAGRAYSSYVDLGAWPEIADLQGPGGMTGTRVGLLRGSYAFGKNQDMVLDVSLEQPQTAVQQGVGLQDIPDIAARFTLQKNWGHLTAMALGRRLKAEASDGSGKDATMGRGVSLSGSWFVPGTSRKNQPSDNLGRRQDFFQFQAQTGPGTGRYSFELGSASTGQDAVYDPQSQSLIALDQHGFFLAYKHWWADRLRSQLVFGQEVVNNLNIQSEDEFHKSVYVVANLVYRAFGRMDLALEWNYGERHNKSGESSHANRFMLVFNYGF